MTVQLPPEKSDITGDLVSGGIGVFGALLGALVAYLLTSLAAKRAKEEATKERDRYQSLSVILKLQSIYATQESIHAQFERAMQFYHEKKLENISMAFSAFANTPQKVTFTTDEVICGADLAGGAVLNILMTLDGNHNATMDMIDAYRIHKLEFQTRLDPVSTGKDGAFTFKITKQKLEMLKPYLTGLDAMVAAMRDNVSRDRMQAYEALVEITKRRLQAFDPGGSFTVDDPGGRTVVISAAGVLPDSV